MFVLVLKFELVSALLIFICKLVLMILYVCLGAEVLGFLFLFGLFFF